MYQLVFFSTKSKINKSASSFRPQIDGSAPSAPPVGYSRIFTADDPSGSKELDIRSARFNNMQHQSNQSI